MIFGSGKPENIQVSVATAVSVTFSRNEEDFVSSNFGLSEIFSLEWIQVFNEVESFMGLSSKLMAVTENSHVQS